VEDDVIILQLSANETLKLLELVIKEANNRRVMRPSGEILSLLEKLNDAIKWLETPEGKGN
jgi:hypothetical protein